MVVQGCNDAISNCIQSWATSMCRTLKPLSHWGALPVLDKYSTYIFWIFYLPFIMLNVSLISLLMYCYEFISNSSISHTKKIALLLYPICGFLSRLAKSKKNNWGSWVVFLKADTGTNSVKVSKALKTTNHRTLYSVHEEGIKSMLAKLSSSAHIRHGLRVTIKQVIK